MRLEASQLLQDQVADGVHPHSVSLPCERVGGVDHLRVLAAIGIVWFHTEGAPYRHIGYSGLPIFLLIFFSLVTNRTTTDPTLGFLRRRWHRLLIPWLFWSVLYGLVRIAQAICFGDIESFHRMLSMETMLMGTHVHLWYLPYAFLSGFLVYAVNRWTSQINHAVLVYAGTAIGVIILILHEVRPTSYGSMRPLPQWEFGLAAIPLGFAIGRCTMIPSKRRRQVLLSMISFGILVTSTVLMVLGHATSVVPYTVAILLVCLAYGWRTQDNTIIAAFAPLTFGVYLIHPLIGYGLRQFIASEQHCAAFIGLTVCFSGLATMALMKTPVRRFV